MKKLLVCLVSFLAIVFASNAATFTVTNTNDAGGGSLRQAIQDAAASNVALPHTINFNLAVGSIITINSDLQINAGNHVGLTINGFVDAVDGPDIIIRGNGTLNQNMVLNNSNGVKIYGLVFDNMENGVRMNTSTGCSVKGCYFGSNLSGTAVGAGLQRSGVWINGGGATAANIIGGLATTLPNGLATSTNNSERCLFVGCMRVLNAAADNVRYGAVLIENAGASQVVNSYFGCNITGTANLGNGLQTTKMPLDHHNILLRNSTPNTIIDRNLLTGATGCGIYVEATGAGIVIKGNIIGLNAATTASIPNEACGIYMEGAVGVLVGGTTALERNIISGNGGTLHNNYNDVCHYGWNDFNQYGVYCKNVTNCLFKGNYIGTDNTGNSSGTANILGNRAGGIKIVSQETGGSSTGNVIGGSAAGEGNTIAGNGYVWGTIVNSPGCGAANPSNITGGPGITFQYATCSNNTVAGNNIGIGADGSTALGNKQEGVSILGAPNNIIGGNTAGAANFIGNNLWGVMLQIDFSYNGGNNALTKAATGNIIIGNSIGVNRSGTAAGNGNRAGDTEGGGVCLQMGSSGNYIGRNNSGEGNIISGNRAGIVFRDGDPGTYAKGAAKNNFVYNNLIGLSIANALTPAQTIYGHGIVMQVGSIGTTFPSGNTIGGVGPNMPNIISGNQQSGIFLHHTTSVSAVTPNAIVGNLIGTNLTGAAAVPNGNNGIEIVNVNNNTMTSNVISGNTQNGILLNNADANTIQANVIGAQAPPGSSFALANGQNGISLINGSSSNIIGAVSATDPNALANTIAFNTQNGVNIAGATSNLNSVHHNIFSCNVKRGIELNAITLGVANAGNDNYAAPTIAGSPTLITVTGPSGSTIELFETDGCATCPTDPTRLQGKQWVKTQPTPLTFVPVAGKTYTALAHNGSTTAAHNTSEFSACYTLCTNPSSVTVNTPAAFCQGGSATLTATVTGGAGPFTYVWRQGTTVVGGNTSTLNVTTAGSYTVEVTSPTTCSATTSTAVTVTVNAGPSVTDQTSTICSGGTFTVTPAGAPAGTTYTWTAPTGTGFTGGAAQSTAQTSISGTLTNSGTTVATAVYTVTPISSASCPGSTFKVTVTVNPKPSVSNQTPAAICSGSSFTVTPSGVPAGTTYSWSAPSGTGFTGGAAGTDETSINGTLTNSGTSAVTATYTVTPKSGSCTGSTFTVTVTVNPKSTIGDQAAPAICSGGTFSFTPTGVPAGTTYTWAAPTGTGFTGGTAQATGQTSISGTLTNSGTTPVTATYVVTPKSGTCTGSTFELTVTINPKPAVSNQTPAAICSGGTFSVTPSGVPAGTTYTWSAPTGTGFSGGASGTDQTSITGTLVNNGTNPATATYTVTPKSGSCSGSTFTVTVTVNPTPGVSNQTATPICSGGTFSVTPSGTPAGTLYTWDAPTGTGFSGGVAQSTGQTSISGTLTNTGITPATAVYLVSLASGTCTGSTFTVSVTINPKSTIGDQASAPICSGGTFSVTPTGVPAGTTYSWSAPSGTGFTGGAAGSNQTSISGTLSTSGTTAVTATYSITPKSGTCTGNTFDVTVTINPKPSVTNQTPADICSGGSFNVSPTGVPAGTTYTWNAPSGSGFSGGAAETTGQSSVSGTLTNTGLTTATATYTVIPTSGASCAGSSFTVTVKINPKSTISDQASPDICSGSTFSVTPTGVPAGTTYTWSAPSGTGFSGGAAESTGQTSVSGTLTNTGITDATAVYTINPVSGTCAGNTFKVTVLIKPKSTIGDQASPDICSGATFSVTPTGVPAGTTYSWSIPTGTGFTGGAAGTNQTEISGTLTNSGTTPVTATYSITPKSGNCTGNTFDLTVNINPTPTVADQTPAAFCSGGSFNVTPSGVASGTTYSWLAPAGTGFTGGAAGTNQPSVSGTLSTTGTSVATATYTVTPSSGTCNGLDFTVTVTINPIPTAPVITPDGPTTFCPGGDVDLTADVAGFTGTFEWFKGTTSLGSANPLTVSTEGTYHVEFVSTANCAAPASAAITIAFAPDNTIADAGTDRTTCNPTFALIGNIPTNGTGAWSVVPPANGASVSVPDATKPYLATAEGLVTGNSYQFTYTVSGACGAPSSETVTITVGLTGFQLLDLNGPTDTLCNKTGRDITAIFTGGSGQYIYHWTSNDGTLNASTTSPTVNVKPSVPSTTYTVYVEDVVNVGCVTNSDNTTVAARDKQDLYIPNLITPNDDNLNDYYKIAEVGHPDRLMFPEGTELMVYNRWGTAVFKATNYKGDWKATELSDGMYYYHLQTGCDDKEYKGWVQILGNTHN